MTAKTNTYLFVALLLICSFVGLSGSMHASAYAKIRMKQVIHSIPCGIDHLTDADGIEHYFAPRSCGKLIEPPSTEIDSSLVSSVNGGGAITGTNPVYLDTATRTAGQDAYLLAAKKGQLYTFHLYGDNSLSPLRTLEVRNVTDDTVTLMFTPGDKEAILGKKGHIDADIAFGADPDVSVRVVDISADKLVSMQVWFPFQRQLTGTAEDTMHSTAAVGLVGTLAILAGLVHYHSRIRMKAL